MNNDNSPSSEISNDFHKMGMNTIKVNKWNLAELLMKNEETSFNNYMTIIHRLK